MTEKSTQCNDVKKQVGADTLLQMARTPCTFDEVAATIVTTRKTRNAAKVFPVDLHVQWHPPMNNSAVLHGKMVRLATGKSCAALVRRGSDEPISVASKQLLFPMYEVGSEVQVLDKKSHAGEDRDKTYNYWYDTTVSEIIHRDKLKLPDYRVNPTHPSEPEQIVSGIDVHHYWWK